MQAILRHCPDLKRLRLSSIDSIEADEALIDALGSEKRLMPHLHLSLQSGSGLILKRMKRRHSPQQALDIIARLRRLRPEIAFGADMIAGFPTETEIEAEESRLHAQEAGIAFLHVFPFSPRKGTPAARMPQLPPAIIKARAAALRATGEVLLATHLSSRVGMVAEVSAKGRDGPLRDFTPVRLPEATAPASS